MNRKLRLLSALLVVVIGGVVLWKSTSSRLDSMRASDDSLSLALAERWGAGLPDGYAKEVADDLDTCGCLFARLTYEDAVDDLLQNWEPVDGALTAAFDAIAEMHLAAELPEDHRTLIESARPQPAESWIGYEMTEGEAALVLLYDPDGRIMYLAERQPVS